jgi:hypothetical protein
MSDDKLNEVVGDSLDKDNELINDMSSVPLEEKKEGPKRIKKQAKEEVLEEAFIEEQVIEEIIEPVLEIQKEEEVVIKEPVKEPIKKSVKEPKAEQSEVIVNQKPKNIKDRHIDMLVNKTFEVRYKGQMIFDSVNKNSSFVLTDTGIIINNKSYKYSEVVIRIKK